QWDFLGDWLWPGAQGVNGNTIETLFFNNCYWIFNLQTAARIAALIGEHDTAATYRARADQVRRAVHAKFFKPEENSYVNGFQGYLAIALLVDLPPQELRPAVWKRLEDEILITRKGHIHAGITGGAFLFKTLLGADRQDLLFTMVNKDTYPSWGLMRRNGLTAIAESWMMDNSLCHSSYLYVGTWFIEGLAGIKTDLDHPGFKHFILKPGVIDDPSMKWVNAHHDCIYGRIVSNWRVDDDRVLTLNVTVPPNTMATLYLPTSDDKTIIEGGDKLAQAKGLKHRRTENGHAVIELTPGNYEFQSSLAVVARP
ncbi:MAG: alpha-L-rhamnosidase C-terminal domain-containing protein, partial [Candidatus Promineifilaceae bacterium]